MCNEIPTSFLCFLSLVALLPFGQVTVIVKGWLIREKRGVLLLLLPLALWTYPLWLSSFFCEFLDYFSCPSPWARLCHRPLCLPATPPPWTSSSTPTLHSPLVNWRLQSAVHADSLVGCGLSPSFRVSLTTLTLLCFSLSGN